MREFRTIKEASEPTKALKPLMVVCELRDCMYHEGDAKGYKGYSMCSHPHKRQYLMGECPLYRLDWQQKLESLRKKPAP
jgi:hypothetical protein